MDAATARADARFDRAAARLRLAAHRLAPVFADAHTAVISPWLVSIACEVAKLFKSTQRTPSSSQMVAKREPTEWPHSKNCEVETSKTFNTRPASPSIKVATPLRLIKKR